MTELGEKTETLSKDKEQTLLDNSNTVESYSGITPPTTLSFASHVYYKVFKCCLLRLCHETQTVERRDSILRHMVAVANRRVYYQSGNWYDILLFLPFSKKIILVWQELLGVRDKRAARGERANQIISGITGLESMKPVNELKQLAVYVKEQGRLSKLQELVKSGEHESRSRASDDGAPERRALKNRLTGIRLLKN